MLLEVENLTTLFRTKRGIIRAVDNVSLSLEKGDFISIVGESGCGKSTLAYSIIRLIDSPGEIAGGKIYFDGKELTSLSEEKMRKVRGKEIGMVFQDPMTSLDPLEKIGDQITETLMEHIDVTKKEAWQIAREMLEKVGLPPDRVESYPHQLSGGQRQRVVIAMAVSLNPKLLIADEPTTALDVIVQEKIMDLLNEMRKEGRAIMLITHDFALAAERSDRIAVMYAGWIIEMGDADRLTKEPMHPYTRGLIESVPDVWVDREIKPLPGFPPDLAKPPEGCRFRPRCPLATEKCMKEPPGVDVDGRYVKCWLFEVK
ncbi:MULTISPECIES: ABC transporter ATP-binding protein [unclassified Archaeoglobus]|jgi:peptide/nickel transport system ATP-binding protein|uniref:ABC transporter ATP-binding protein n=1 Tax=unclassified Archaeoglobus TaxID=2643606 RepID=UPI0025B87BD8|nr:MULTISPECIES: ABC transporter ATP-binding protein [unclassified Archaeoglobus]